MKLKFIILLFLGLILQACNAPDQNELKTYTANEGVIDLSDWHQEDNLIPLDGEWELYWKQLLEPNDFPSGSSISGGSVIDLPKIWDDHIVNGEALPNEGYATYRLKVSNATLSDVLGLQIPYMYSNYKLWVDDQLIAKNGQVGMDGSMSRPQKRPQVVYFSPKDNTFSITLQISNYHHIDGGILDPITLGSSQSINTSHVKDIAFQSILIGFLVLAGIYHLGLGFFRKVEPYFFYFGALCLVAAFRHLMVGDVFFTKIFPNVDWNFAVKLDYISLYSHVPLLAMVLYRLYPKESYRWFTITTIIFAITFSLLTILTQPRTFLLFEVYFHFFMILCVCYTMVVVVRSLKSKHEERYYLIIGIVLLMVTILLDIAVKFLRLPDVDLYPIGLVFLMICLSLVISRRLSNSLDLSKKLAYDLAQLNSGLEAQVEDRTKQLQQSNKKLEELNNKLKNMALIDGLTKIPNRRHFDEYFQEQYEICSKENIPLSILFLDIDYFKHYNDFYGHQKGDECLQQVVQELDKQIGALPNGLVARYGGEEFVCLIPKLSQAEVERIANDINHGIENLKIDHETSPISNYVTISIGQFTTNPNPYVDIDTFLKKADEALYQAKAAGRNQIVPVSSQVLLNENKDR
ncbi:sensor domain-containing diguanylate cyclase [Gracilibacillus massiliensis]|uniref:sensor domain-containing diguanylate cyclase n=1 Tax=Gracilibacillus massiliensis TaxID=1564956 RepID=UPI00071C7FAD|nr:diguanylate cyclase [Gracilibacillus massiliensis]